MDSFKKMLKLQRAVAEKTIELIDDQLAAHEDDAGDDSGEERQTPPKSKPGKASAKSGKPTPTTKKKAIVEEPEEDEENEENEDEATDSDDGEADEASEEVDEIDDDEIRTLVIAYAKKKGSPAEANKLLAKYKVQKSKQLNQKARAEIKATVAKMGKK